MRIVVPMRDGKFSEHFGQSRQAAVVDLDEAGERIESMEVIDLPPHGPGVLPAFLNEWAPDLMLAGGIGERAVIMFAEAGVRVHAGVEGEDPRAMVEAWVRGELPRRSNVCHRSGPPHEDGETGLDGGTNPTCGDGPA